MPTSQRRKLLQRLRSRYYAAQWDAGERVLIDSLFQAQGNVARAAVMLGVPRTYVYKLLKRYRISAKTYRPTGADRLHAKEAS